MQGLTEKSDKLFEKISKLNCIKEYTLVGGSAIAFQIYKRKSEDLDFCKWSENLKAEKQPEVNWPAIEKELSTIGIVESKDILGFDQVNFIVDGIKVSFFTKQKNLSPVKESVQILNNIKSADLDSLGAMKVELILRRNEWRDYYDIYSLLKEGKSIKKMVTDASEYSNHILKIRDALGYLSNGKNFKKEKDFNLLEPVYNIDSKEIEEFIKSKISKEYTIEAPGEDKIKDK
jgi:hypothetical protein